jgi:hypothetical protein
MKTVLEMYSFVPVLSANPHLLLCSPPCSGDLDVVLKLRCHGGAAFDSCRRELLAAVAQQLCRAAGAGAGGSAADAGWVLKPCHSEHFLRLEHPQL